MTEPATWDITVRITSTDNLLSLAPRIASAVSEVLQFPEEIRHFSVERVEL